MQSQPVIVRHYRNDKDFASDAAAIARSGYRVASTSHETKMTIGGQIWMLLAAVCLVGGLLISLYLWIGTVVFLLIGLTGRRQQMVVTYQRS